MDHIPTAELRANLREMKTTVENIKFELELANIEIRSTEAFCTENNLLNISEHFSHCVDVIEEKDAFTEKGFDRYYLRLEWRLHQGKHRLCSVIDHQSVFADYDEEKKEVVMIEAEVDRLPVQPLSESRQEIRLRFRKYLSAFLHAYNESIKARHYSIGNIPIDYEHPKKTLPIPAIMDQMLKNKGPQCDDCSGQNLSVMGAEACDEMNIVTLLCQCLTCGEYVRSAADYGKILAISST